MNLKLFYSLSLFAFVNLAVLIIVMVFADFSTYVHKVAFFNIFIIINLKSVFKINDIDIIYIEQDKIGINWIFTSILFLINLASGVGICLLMPKF